MHPDDHFTEPAVLSYYRAPRGVPGVRPRRIAEGCEAVEILTNGGVYFDAGDGERYYTKGTIFWHFPGDYTICRYEPDRPYECMAAAFFHPGPYRRIAPRVTVMRHPESVLDLVSDFLQAFHQDTVDRTFLTNCLHSRLLWEAYCASEMAPPPGTPGIVRDALTLIERDFASELTVPVLAERLGISEPKLYMLFRKHLKDSPHARIQARRLREAEDRLTAGMDPLKIVAQDCGFASLEHFCRLFRTRFGMTPTEYRKKHGFSSRVN